MAFLNSYGVGGWMRAAGARRAGVVCAALALGLALVTRGWAGVEDAETKVKAAYAFNFTKHVEWPAERFSGAGAPILVGVLGDSVLGEVIQRTVGGRSSQGRAVEVRSCGRVEELAGCHLVFLRQKEAGQQREILKVLQGKPVLMVVESDAFFSLGAHVRLLMRADGSVGYWVNRGVADKCGVRIGARMLQHADRVLPQASLLR